MCPAAGCSRGRKPRIDPVAVSKHPLAYAMQGIASPTELTRRSVPVCRVLVKFYRSRKGKSAVPAKDLFVGSGYAERRDRNVASADVEGVTTFRKAREYRMLRDIKFRGPDDDQVSTFGEAAMGTQAMGSEPSPAPSRNLGSGVTRGLMLEDTETGQLYSVDGVKRDTGNDRLIIIECGSERTF